jgi:hypothetical protein
MSSRRALASDSRGLGAWPFHHGALDLFQRRSLVGDMQARQHASVGKPFACSIGRRRLLASNALTRCGPYLAPQPRLTHATPLRRRWVAAVVAAVFVPLLVLALLEEGAARRRFRFQHEPVSAVHGEGQPSILLQPLLCPSVLSCGHGANAGLYSIPATKAPGTVRIFLLGTEGLSASVAYNATQTSAVPARQVAVGASLLEPALERATKKHGQEAYYQERR